MKKLNIINKLSGTVSKVGFQIKKYSPEILVVAGVTGAVVSAVMACKATLKVNEILDEAKDNIDTIHEVADNPEMAEKYSPEDTKKDLVVVYAQTGMKLAKLYAPSVALGALSITSIFASNNILRKRNIALAAAYTAVEKGFKEYRSRVVERFGEDLDRELLYNIKAKEIEETVVNEKGEEEIVKKSVEVAEIEGCSPFARYFTASSKCYEGAREYNLLFLRAQQQYANDLLVSRGNIFLNEVFDMLDLPRCEAGQIVGWKYDPKNPVGDNFVDFGIQETYRETENGVEPVILLDFNVDGNILKRI